MAKIIVSDGNQHVEYELEHLPLSIGRLDTNEIQINDPSVSKIHAQISPTADGTGWVLEDRGSSNGTIVGGEMIAQRKLSPGDTIHCGNVQLEFRDDAAITREDDSSSGAVRVLASMAIQDSLNLNVAALASQHALDGSRENDETSEWNEKLGANDSEHPAERKLRLIQLISEKTIRTFETKQLAEEVLVISMEFVQASRGSICLFDDGIEFHPLATVGFPSGEQPRVSRTVLRRLLNEHAGVLIRPDSQEGEALMSLHRMAVSSTLCVPLWTMDRIMGFLSLDRAVDAPPFSTSQLDLMIAVGHQAAVGIERGRLALLASQEADARSYLSRYLDRKLVHQIMSADKDDEDDPLAPAEREVTILFFSDIVSFTKIGERLEPTELSLFIREYLTAMTDIITQHGGTIDKYIGDAVMALFGAPISNPAAASGAIAAALTMKEFAEKMVVPGQTAVPLRVRFGIATGKAVIGNIGSLQRVEYTALGDTVNIASRLETFARPGEICIDEVTKERVEEADFAIQQIGAIDVKNRVQPVEVFKVLG